MPCEKPSSSFMMYLTPVCRGGGEAEGFGKYADPGICRLPFRGPSQRTNKKSAHTVYQNMMWRFPVICCCAIFNIYNF